MIYNIGIKIHGAKNAGRVLIIRTVNIPPLWGASIGWLIGWLVVLSGWLVAINVLEGHGISELIGKLFQFHQSFLSMLRGWVAELKGEWGFLNSLKAFFESIRVLLPWPATLPPAPL